MRLYHTLTFLFLFTLGHAQSNLNSYLDKIRDNEAALTAFFSQMPKGGDLHHHYSGSIYTEPLLEYAISADLYLNTTTMEVKKEKPLTGTWELFSTLKNRGVLNEFKQKVMQKWSVKDYNHVDYPADKLFFEAFNKFTPAATATYIQGLLELKKRAMAENLSYIETQFTTIPIAMNTDDLSPYNAKLRTLATSRNEGGVKKILDSIYTVLLKRNASTYAEDFNTNFVTKLHNNLKLDDSRFKIRYQNYVLRFREPVDLFKSLVVAFISANTSPLVVGVNIVAPEDEKISMQDYWLHMIMFNYCHTQFPKVKYAMHAGELTLGLVAPELLTYHINDAVYIAGANRIGHGVDMAYEAKPYDLLRYMAKNKIPVEINLASNEFILNVKNSRHPFSLYKEYGVPIVISTDDAGILRTNSTEQYVLLASRYKNVSYNDIKQYVYNSIQYSFIKEETIKKELLENLDLRFKEFETLFPSK